MEFVFRTCLLVAVLVGASFGQLPRLATATTPSRIQSGLIQNPTSSMATVWSQSVHVPGASSLRLDFGEVKFGDPADAIVVRNPLDRDSHRIDREGLVAWQGKSAWFNGDALEVSLDLVPGSFGSVQVQSTTWIVAGPNIGTDDLCSTDNRTPSADNRVFRLFITDAAGSGVCTGFLVNDHATYLTAGHCFPPTGLVSVIGEFNVPPSLSDGTIVHPPVADQFTTDLTTLFFNDGGIGQDWGAARLLPSSNGTNASVAFGFFGLATTWLGTISSTARVTGYGADMVPTPSRNFTQQSSTGPHSGLQLNLQSPLLYAVDTEGGNSGSPVIQEQTGLVAAIHTNGTCASTGFNRGTGITNPSLLSGLVAAGGCDGTHLLEDGPIPIVCSPTVWSAPAMQGRWNVVGLSGPNDWNIFRQNIGSVNPGDACDFLIANGNLGGVPPAAGEIRQVSGTGVPRAQFSVAQQLALDQITIVNWSTNRILKPFQFTIAGPGTVISVAVNGDPSLRWHLYAPNAISGATWRPRGSNLFAQGQAGGTPVSGITIAQAGVYALVVFRDGGAAPTSLGQLAVSISTNPALPLSLVPNVPASVPTGTAPLVAQFSFSPAVGVFNAVGVASASDTTLTVGAGVSAGAAIATEFVITAQNGIGSVLTTGTLSAPASTSSLVVEQATAQAATVGGVATSSLLTGHVLKVLSYSVATSDIYEILLTGDPSLHWYLFSAGTTDAWRGRFSALANGQVGDFGSSLALNAGNHALVITRNSGVAQTNLGFTARLGLLSSHITLTGPGSFSGALAFSGYEFTVGLAPNQWTVVGINGTLNSSYAISIANQSIGTSSANTAYVVANGRLGLVDPRDGLLSHSGTLSHATFSTLHQSATSSANTGTPASLAWPLAKILHVFEVTVPLGANYDVTVTGPTGLRWALFDPGTSAAWRTRTQNIGSGVMGPTVSALTLSPGVHAVVVSRASTTGVTGTVVCNVALSSNPAPTLSGALPSAIPAGSPTGSILLSGTGFTPFTTVAWDATIPLVVVSQTPTQLAVVIPASLVQAPGSHSIIASNPAPGGGPSSPLSFSVLAPSIATVAPPSIAPIPPGGSPVTITVDGTGFTTASLIHAGIATIPTTFVSPTRLTGIVGSSVPDSVFTGGLAITVENTRAAQSNTRLIQVSPGGNNAGTSVRAPLDPFPLETYSARLEGGAPNQPFSFLLDYSYPAPVVHWPDLVGDMVLRILNPATTLPLLDGIGLYGPASGGAVFGFDPLGSAPGGTFTMPGFVWPPAPLNVRISLQLVYLDPTAAYGFNLGWPRTEDL